MANIIRCELPDGVHRYKPFTVTDYRDFILVRNDMVSKSPQEQKQMIDELVSDYFPELSKAFGAYVFLKVFLSSIGKTKIPIRTKCPKCGEEKTSQFDLRQGPLENPSVVAAGLKITLKFPDKDYEDLAQMITDNILSVSDSNGEYEWNSLSDFNKLQVIEALDIETFEELIKKMRVFDFTLRTSCCERQESKYTDLLSIFKLLLHPDEVFTFYRINHLITKNGYDLNSVMNMIPIERGIALSLIEKDLK